MAAVPARSGRMQDIAKLLWSSRRSIAVLGAPPFYLDDPVFAFDRRHQLLIGRGLKLCRRAICCQVMSARGDLSPCILSADSTHAKGLCRV